MSKYATRLAITDADIRAAQVLRQKAFLPEKPGRDVDEFDARCDHLLVERVGCGALVATCRMMVLDAPDLPRTYSAQFYDLSNLASLARPMIELGRFCTATDQQDPDIIRSAWAAITSVVDARGVGLIFGCSSFRGTDADVYADALAFLGQRHLAPPNMRPARRAPNVVDFGGWTQNRFDQRQALKTMPPLLRSYLALGGWVSDHAVIDRAMNTLHVFTGLEIANVPAARAKRLRNVAV